MSRLFCPKRFDLHREPSDLRQDRDAVVQRITVDDRSERVRHRAAAAVLTAICMTLSAGCGTRVPHAQVVAGTSPGEVTLTPDSIRALSEPGPAAARAPGSAAGSPVTPTVSQSVGGSAPAAAQAEKKSTATTAAVATAPASTTQPCSGPQTPVAIGQVGTFSGVAGPITASSRALMAAWAADLNSRGGLACHPVQVFTTDDGGDPSRAAAQVHDLVARHHVAALVGNLAIFSVGGFRPAVEAERLPAVGGAGGGGKDDFESPYFFPAGSSVDDLAVGLIGNAVAAGHTKLGLLYCVEVNGCAQIYSYVHDHAAKEAGAQLVYSAPVSLAQTDYTAQCLNARDAGVEVLGLAMDGASINRLVRSCAAVGYKPQLASSASLLTADQTRDPVLRSFGLASATPVVPWLFTDQPGLREYHRVMSHYAPNVAPDGGSVITWAAATLFEHAIEQVADTARRAPITPALVLQGLGKIRHDTLGGVAGPISFTPNQAHATSNGCVFYMTLTTSGWTAPRGSKPVCR
jgi:branched-chain amino acid transport system substrate-binding protein